MNVWLSGLCLAKLKKLSMAFDDFDVAIEMEPNNPNHYFSRLISGIFSSDASHLKNYLCIRSNVWADMGKHQAAVEGLKPVRVPLSDISTYLFKLV